MTCGIDKIFIIKSKENLLRDPTQKRNLVWEQDILILTDPTPERNLFRDWWIPPRRKFWVGDSKGNKLKLCLKLSKLAPHKQQQLSPFQDLVKRCPIFPLSAPDIFFRETRV